MELNYSKSQNMFLLSQIRQRKAYTGLNSLCPWSSVFSIAFVKSKRYEGPHHSLFVILSVPLLCHVFWI